MKILVTGGAGFIGSNFVRHLLGCRPHEVVNFDKLTYAGNLANLGDVDKDKRYSFVKGDICDATAVEGAMRGCEAIVHFAAESHVDRSIYEPSVVIETNVKGTFTLLEAARKLGVARFVHISTDEVYGEIPAGVLSDEERAMRPSSPYSASKAAADLMVRSYVATYGLPAIVVRPSNNYGPHQFLEKFIPLMIDNAKQGKPLPIYGDGKQQRNWIHVEDNCRAIVKVLEEGRAGETYNAGGSDIHENEAIAKMILRIMGKPENLVSHVTDRPGHDRRYAMNCRKITSELGWKPTIALEEGLRQTVAWYEENTSWVEGVRGGEYQRYYQKYYGNRDQSLKQILSPKN